jgi:hypothetical protein
VIVVVIVVEFMGLFSATPRPSAHALHRQHERSEASCFFDYADDYDDDYGTSEDPRFSGSWGGSVEPP